MLSDALKRLPNLSVIGMRRSEDHRPWGWERLKDAVGVDPRVVGPYPGGAKDNLSEPTRLFIAIMSAVANAETPLVRLYTDAIEIDNIPAEVLPQDRLDIACRHLLYLEINIHKGWLNKRPQIVMCNAEAHYGEGLLRLFKAARNMRELGLQVFAESMRMYMSAPTTVDQYSWLRAYPHITLKKQVDNVQLAHLRRLKLEKISTSPDVLQSLMAPSQNTLTSVKLRDMRLLSPKNTTRTWQPIFVFFRDCCPELSYLLLYHLMYEGGGVSFVENPPTPVAYLDIQDPNDNPNPPYGEPAGGEFFTKYDYIALEASGRTHVEAQLARIVGGHWYQNPIFSYAMDEELWHTDTSDEEG
jgi:hypothetical protein